MWQFVFLLGCVGAVTPKQLYPASTTALHKFENPSFSYATHGQPSFYHAFSKFFPTYKSVPLNSVHTLEKPKFFTGYKTPVASLGYFPSKVRTNAASFRIPSNNVIAYSAAPVVAVSKQYKPLPSIATPLHKPVVSFKSSFAPSPKKITFNPNQNVVRSSVPVFSFDDSFESIPRERNLPAFIEQLFGFGGLSPEPTEFMPVPDSASFEDDDIDLYGDSASEEFDDEFFDDESSEEEFYRRRRSVLSTPNDAKSTYQIIKTDQTSVEGYDNYEKRYYANLAFGSNNNEELLLPPSAFDSVPNPSVADPLIKSSYTSDGYTQFKSEKPETFDSFPPIESLLKTDTSPSLTPEYQGPFTVIIKDDGWLSSQITDPYEQYDEYQSVEDNINNLQFTDIKTDQNFGKLPQGQQNHLRSEVIDPGFDIPNRNEPIFIFEDDLDEQYSVESAEEVYLPIGDVNAGAPLGEINPVYKDNVESGIFPRVVEPQLSREPPVAASFKNSPEPLEKPYH